MTTQFPVRTRSVVDTQRNDAIPQQRLLDTTSSSRPLSWHPTLANDFSQYHDLNQSFMYPYGQPSQYTTYAYGLVTPMTYPTEVEPYTDCATTPLDQLTEQHYQYLQNDVQSTNPYHQHFAQSLASYTPASAPPVEAMGYTNIPWPSMAFSGNHNVTTAPASPNYLPIPDMGQPFDFPEIEPAEDEKEELVGMGLYDSPDQAQSSSLLFGSAPVQRKSLKLEESFEPPPDDDDDEEDAESESVNADDEHWSQEESGQTQSFQVTQPLEPFPDYTDKTFMYQSAEPYLVGDHPSQHYYGTAEGLGVPAYGWF